MPGNHSGCGAGGGGGDNCCGAQIRCGGAAGIGDGVGDGRPPVSESRGQQGLVIKGVLGDFGTTDQKTDSIERIDAHSRFGREHYGIGAVIDGIGHIVRFSPGGGGAGDH